MRLPILVLVALLGLFALPATHGPAAITPQTTVSAMSLDAAQAPASPPQVTVQVQHSGRGWYASPVWMAIGAIGLVVIVLLIVVASRGGGGGTTIVRG
jgi:hypothetical protein